MSGWIGGPPGAGNDTYVGTAGNDTPGTGQAGKDSMSGLGGDDSRRGADDNGTLLGGKDTLRGDGGADSLDGDEPGRGAWTLAVTGTTATVTDNGRVGNAVLTVLNHDAADKVMCFAEGTLILTPDGECPVERLRAGDLVVTPGGPAPVAPLRWVGHLHVDLARQRDRTRIAPVMIKAGALAEGVPFRDLHVSPDHGVLVDGRLVAARLLLNGITIVQQTWLREVTYHHLELARHDVLVSEGALTESYLDDGNRHLFGNPGIVALGIDLSGRRDGGARAPVMAEGDPALVDIRRRIAARAGFLQGRRNRA